MTPAEIAKKLTPAQKRALLWLPRDGRWRVIDVISGAPGRDALKALALKHLVISKVGSGSWIWQISPKGQPVRAILAQEPTP